MKFKIGFREFATKSDKADPAANVIELMQNNMALGMDCATLRYAKYDFEKSHLEEIAAAKKEMDFGICIACPGTTFRYAPNYDKATELVGPEKSIQIAKALGEKFVRVSYGRLDCATTRYNLGIPLEEHIKSVADGVKAILPLCKEYDIDIVIENHCDFSGPEMARVMDMVDSEYAGIFIDTGNAATVWCDPLVDNYAMWPYMKHAGHMKDVKGRLDPDFNNDFALNKNGRFPVQVVGCYPGEGMVPFQGMIDYLNTNSGPDDTFYCMSEGLWGYEGFDNAENDKRTVEYMRKITNTPAPVWNK